MELSKYHSNFFEFFEFQKEAVSFMKSKNKALLGLPTGSGKTAVSLSTYCYLKEQQENLKLLFITDKSVIHQIVDSVYNFTLLSVCHVYANPRKERLSIYKNFKDNCDILVINYAMVRTDCGKTHHPLLDTLNEIGEDNLVVVCDEANYVSNIKTNTSLILHSVCKAVKYSYMLTATPTKGKLEQFFSIIHCLGCNKYSYLEFLRQHSEVGSRLEVKAHSQHNGVTYFEKVFRNKKGDYVFSLLKSKYGIESSDTLQNTNIHYLDKKDRLYLLIKQSEVEHYSNMSFNGIDTLHRNFTLNYNKINIRIQVKIHLGVTKYTHLSKFLADYQDILYSKSKKEIAPFLPKFSIIKRLISEDKVTYNAVKSLITYYQDKEVNHMQMLIALSYPQYCNNYGAEVKDNYNNPKVDEVTNIIHNLMDDDEQAIIYHPSKTVINYFHKHFSNYYNCSIITGDIVDDRQYQKELFTTKESKLLFITDAGGVGVDGLQVSNNIIFLGMPHTGGQLTQIAGRISRINTSHSNLNLYFVLIDKSIDYAKYEAIMGQIRFMTIVSKDSIDDGLLDNSIKALDPDYADEFLVDKMKKYKTRY